MVAIADPSPANTSKFLPPTMTSAPSDQPQSVRFSDVHDEIEPVEAVQHLADITESGKDPREGPLSPQAQEELRNLSTTMQKSRFQARRMEHFSFEPVSLPPSRVSRSPNHLTTIETEANSESGSLTLTSFTDTIRTLWSSCFAW